MKVVSAGKQTTKQREVLGLDIWSDDFADDFYTYNIL